MLGQCLHIAEASKSFSETPHSIGLLWASDHSVAENSYLETPNKHNR